MTCRGDGANLRCGKGSEELSKRRKARELVWDLPEHIHVLEWQGALTMIRWSAQALGRQQRVFLHLLDSM
eukprot:9371422-Pyramimonas_sp.AAC.1